VLPALPELRLTIQVEDRDGNASSDECVAIVSTRRGSLAGGVRERGPEGVAGSSRTAFSSKWKIVIARQ
jgi:hypothetical protein